MAKRKRRRKRRTPKQPPEDAFSLQDALDSIAAGNAPEFVGQAGPIAKEIYAKAGVRAQHDLTSDNFSRELLNILNELSPEQEQAFREEAAASSVPLLDHMVEFLDQRDGLPEADRASSTETFSIPVPEKYKDHPSPALALMQGLWNSPSETSSSGSLPHSNTIYVPGSWSKAEREMFDDFERSQIEGRVVAELDGWVFQSRRDWVHGADDARVFKIDPDLVGAHINYAWREVPFNIDYGRLPFPRVYVGWGGSFFFAMRDDEHRYIEQIFGFVLDAKKRQTFAVMSLENEAEVWSVFLSEMNPEGSMWARIVEHILECITTHEIQKTPFSKKRIKAMRKAVKSRGVPDHFYEVLQQPLVRHKPEPSGHHASPSFQHDVRGHWAHRVKRIQGKLSSREKSRWMVRNNEQHQYRFIDGYNVTREDREFLASIDEKPPGKGWYLRVTRYWVKGHKRGPEGTYVPSLHVMGPNLATHPEKPA